MIRRATASDGERGTLLSDTFALSEHRHAYGGAGDVQSTDLASTSAMIKMETRDWVALASAAVGLATFLVFRAKPEPKPKDAPWARSKKKGETGYYYGHQNLTGGYTDGLQASDYAMNGPRKLDSATKKPVAVDSETAVNKPRAPIASAPVIHSETIKRVTRYAWSDTPSTVKVSIEDAGTMVPFRRPTCPWRGLVILRSRYP